jgi:hypothetical protein
MHVQMVRAVGRAVKGQPASAGGGTGRLTLPGGGTSLGGRLQGGLAAIPLNGSGLGRFGRPAP